MWTTSSGTGAIRPRTGAKFTACYSIYSHDIKPLGFRVVEMDDFVSNETIRRTVEVLDNPSLAEEMVDVNYDLALKYFSYANLEKKLWYIARSFYGVEEAALGCP